MTESYIKKLLKLKDELVAESKDLKFDIDIGNKEFIEKWQRYMSKLNYLCGYIEGLRGKLEDD